MFFFDGTTREAFTFYHEVLGGDATDIETARGWFEALAKDGRVVLPMGKQQWGDVYGQAEDKFGIFRSVNIPST
ncbi:hypothetical protein EJK80_02550 [Corynebacterium phoceense]|uniref:VOC family protein n=1 Tax=Corynebacterium phoceense TaxID=1686286 RepID=A0A540R9U7_9CORY|nr:hypothetical protein EJK80_02550 [Corynebacterium phoceense]